MLKTLAALLAGNAKAAAIVGAAAVASTAGGVAVATVATSGNSHAAAGLATAAAAHAAAHPGDNSVTPDETAPVVAESTSPAATPTESASPADTKVNHGTCVSLAAHSTPAATDSPNAHGKLVSEIAKSDCGKATDGETHGKSGESHGKSEATDGKPTAMPTQAKGYGKGGNPAHGKPTTEPTGDSTDSTDGTDTGASHGRSGETHGQAGESHGNSGQHGNPHN